MSGSVSTCQALTAASAPEDTHCKEMVNVARVSGVVHTVWCIVYGIHLYCMSAYV